jgi:hypothetical protein
LGRICGNIEGASARIVPPIELNRAGHRRRIGSILHFAAQHRHTPDVNRKGAGGNAGGQEERCVNSNATASISKHWIPVHSS